MWTGQRHCEQPSPLQVRPIQIPTSTKVHVLEFCGGVTSEATDRSIDCLVSTDGSIPRSVISSIIDVLVPIGAILIFAAFWAIISLRNKRELVYLIRRSALSAVAVFYISYISITQTLVNILNCVEVHDSVNILVDSTTDYWAVDTSLKCNDGSHAVLAAAMGWPFLVIFSFGFPIVMACLIVKNLKDNFKEGWIYDVAGFMYRSYRPQFVFWESIIMLRKAILAVVVVFAYPLGSDLQVMLAVFVLALALYAQKICCPFREEFDQLNEMEGVSLLFSQLTFILSLVFESNRVPEGVRIFVTIVICLCNIGLFLFFIRRFLIFSAKYLKSVLDREDVPYNSDKGTWHVIKVYVVNYLGSVTIHKLVRMFYCIAGKSEAS